MRDKRSAQHVISSYQKRQQRMDMLLPFFWLGVMFLIVFAGFLVYRYLRPAAPLLLDATATLPLTVDPTLSSPATPTFAALDPASAALPAQTEISAATPTPSGPVRITYTVEQGDTLAGIAAFFEVDITTVMHLNPEVTPEFLQPGTELTIPVEASALITPTSGTTAIPGLRTIVEYQVVSGDTLAWIAANHGSTIDDIVRENGLESADQISVGQTLRIPVVTGAEPTAAPAQPSPAVELSPTP